MCRAAAARYRAPTEGSVCSCKYAAVAPANLSRATGDGDPDTKGVRKATGSLDMEEAAAAGSAMVGFGFGGLARLNAHPVRRPSDELARRRRRASSSCRSILALLSVTRALLLFSMPSLFHQ